MDPCRFEKEMLYVGLQFGALGRQSFELRSADPTVMNGVM